MGIAPNGTEIVLDLTDRVRGATATETDDEYAVEWQIEETTTVGDAVRDAAARPSGG